MKSIGKILKRRILRRISILGILKTLLIVLLILLAGGILYDIAEERVWVIVLGGGRIRVFSRGLMSQTLAESLYAMLSYSVFIGGAYLTYAGLKRGEEYTIALGIVILCIAAFLLLLGLKQHGIPLVKG